MLAVSSGKKRSGKENFTMPSHTPNPSVVFLEFHPHICNPCEINQREDGGVESPVVITKDQLGGKMGYDSHNDRGGDGYRGGRGGGSRNNKDRGDEVFSKRIPAGKRTYFFDVKSTRSGDDYFITITESKRVDDGRYEKHKIFLYKEDFGKFLSAAHEVVQHVQEECLPDYDFKDVPEYIPVERDEYDDDEDYNE